MSFDLSACLTTFQGKNECFHSESGSGVPADNVEFIKIRGCGPEHGEPDNCCFLFPPSFPTFLSPSSAGSTATSSVYLTLKRLLLCTVELWCISLALLFTAAQSSWDGLCGASPFTKWVLHELEETKHFWPYFLTPACSETAFETGP